MSTDWRTDLPGKAPMRALGALELRNLEGAPVRLSTLWKQRAVALVFLRHYG